jgi:uncharacterized membrane-anchored protein YhcB (DUF1043 family)
MTGTTTYVTLELWQLVSLLLTLVIAVVGAFWAMAKVIARQSKDQIELQFKAIEKHLGEQDGRLQKLENQVTELRVELPRDYTRRDDHIRDIGTIATKIEALALYFERVVRDAPSDILKLIRDELRKESGR